MRSDAIFIGVEVDDAVAGDAELAAKLDEVCPVSIFAAEGGRVAIVDENIDECILCGLCIKVAPPGTVRVHKLYSDELLDAPA
jgi:NAD-dependent dihydropyrimidine dehydrogenase PreA subunit